MTKRMLIDATHPEETRVAVISGNKLEEYDFETICRKQLKSNIYLVKVTRVEPSLQAAFVDYGGNRHGFLPFPEIHPDYYRIPIADREAILAEERALAKAQADKEAAEDEAALAEKGDSSFFEDETIELEIDENALIEEIEEGDEDYFPEDDFYEEGDSYALDLEIGKNADESSDEDSAPKKGTKGKAAAFVKETVIDKDATPEDQEELETESTDSNTTSQENNSDIDEGDFLPENKTVASKHEKENIEEEEDAICAIEENEETSTEEESEVEEVSEDNSDVENVGGDVIDAPTFRSNRQKRYKIQEVIKRNQIMLIQISKEERGNKGAAVTSYISLPGRYCVLMPNSPRGGGVSRKVSNIKDRQRLKKILNSLNVPEGMSVILRTAGVSRTEAEIKRDLEYLLRLWNQIRELTLKSTAPALIYEEGNLIKRSIRDLYKRDIDEVLVAGEGAFKTAKEFMSTLVPEHVDKVQLYKDTSVPLFFRYQVESQIDEIYSTTVHLKSGGYIVINPTEALVSIDVNSGKSTKGRHIEETALKTNIEAAEEVARQVRLRDQGGLVVIDFIDMEDPRNNRIVERKLKSAMAGDRARIQIGRISPFGLLELSRQRLNPSIVETSFEICPACEGRGVVRTVETAGIGILRAIEEEGLKGKASEVQVNLPSEIAVYIFNNKKESLAKIEEKYDMRITLHIDDTILKPNYSIEITKTAKSSKRDKRNKANKQAPIKSVDISDLNDIETSPEAETADSNVTEKESKTRRRGRRGGRKRTRRRNDERKPATESNTDEKTESKNAGASSDNSAASEGEKKPRKTRSRRNYKPRKKAGEEKSKGEEKPKEKKEAKQSLPLSTPANETKKDERKGWWRRLTE